MHTPISVANFFIKKGIDEGSPITLMQVMKLVYFANGWNLAINGQELFIENFQAWRFGPVLESLYHFAKVHGSAPITKLLVDSLHPETSTSRFSQKEYKVLEAVWENYGKRAAFELSDLTHEKGSPWSQVYRDGDGDYRYNRPIPNRIIQKFFQSKMEVNDTRT